LRERDNEMSHLEFVSVCVGKTTKSWVAIHSKPIHIFNRRTVIILVLVLKFLSFVVVIIIVLLC
jgi:hypothetical protein